MKEKLKRRMRFTGNVIKELYRRFGEHSISYTSGQIAYFFILSIFPFLIFTNAIIASLNIPSNAVTTFLSPFFPKEIVSFITNYIAYINTQSSFNLLSFGIIIALFSASKSIRSLVFAFNEAYSTKQTRSLFARIFFSMVYIVVFSLLLVIAISIIALGNEFVSDILSQITFNSPFIDVLSIWRWLTMAIFLFIVFSVAYKFLPTVKIKFSETVPGTIFSIIGFLILTSFFSAYVNYAVSSVSFYGSVGLVFLLMLWMYFAGIILVLGAELNSIVSEIKKDNAE